MGESLVYLHIIYKYVVVVESSTSEVSFYTYGIRDLCSTLYYTMLAIVLHAVLQEYVLDVSTTLNVLFPVRALLPL